MLDVNPDLNIAHILNKILEKNKSKFSTSKNSSLVANINVSLDENGEIKINEHHVGVEVKKEDLEKVLESVNMGNKASCSASITLPEKTKEELMACLSVGEKRALYLLQILFDLERIKDIADKTGQKQC